jgi:mRNA interferase RelE/StbE
MKNSTAFVGHNGHDGDDDENTWKAGASRDMDRLPRAIASAVVEIIYGPLAQNLHRVGKPLRFELAGKRSARRGNYRDT